MLRAKISLRVKYQDHLATMASTVFLETVWTMDTQFWTTPLKSNSTCLKWTRCLFWILKEAYMFLSMEEEGFKWLKGSLQLFTSLIKWWAVLYEGRRPVVDKGESTFAARSKVGITAWRWERAETKEEQRRKNSSVSKRTRSSRPIAGVLRVKGP